MNNRLLKLAGALALLAVLGRFYAKPLFAQVRAALVSNIDEPLRAPYQAVIDNVCSTFTCTFNTNPIPANKRLHVTHITTSWFGNHVVYVYTDHSLPGFVVNPLTTTFVPLTNQYIVDQPLDLHVDGGEAIHIKFVGSVPPAINLEAIVTGYLVDCSTAPCAPTISQ